MDRFRLSPLVLLAAAAFPPAATAEVASQDSAERLLLTGRYGEAADGYAALSDTLPGEAAIGLARCREAQGDIDGAAAELARAIEDHPESPLLHAEWARLAQDRGEYALALAAAERALALDENQLLARWTRAELWRLTGKLDAAEAEYLWMVRHYNRRQKEITSAGDLRWIGLAAAQYARWKRNSGQFSFLVNRLYPKALSLNDRYWPARLESALLFLEKYNERDAAKEIDAGLAINPQAAELHCARAALALQSYDLDAAQRSVRAALAINPRLAWARRLEADLLLADFRPREAIDLLSAARALNPADEETLGRLAAAYGVVDGLPAEEGRAGDESRMSAVIEQATAANERCGVFFAALAEALDRLRRYPQAIAFYEESRRRMPQLILVPGELGMVYMRLGEEGRAAAILAESFRLDPFNVRVKNTLEVLDVLKGFAVIETEHFVIRFDRGRDGVLAELAARYLEDVVYPRTVAAMRFEPPAKSLFEIFSRSGSTSGHGWFSARMVGLPYIGTVGACAGKVVALASPNDTPRPYNWGRVLRHEFVHVVNLQQTGFNVPHWFTEALAVRMEELPRPESWNEVFVRRATEDRLFDLGTINRGFIRPADGDDWALAYCQAEQYADYMTETYGEDAAVKMLAAYGDNLSTAEAIERSFDVDLDTFEEGYFRYAKQQAAQLAREMSARTADVELLEKLHSGDPGDDDIAARLASARLENGEQEKAQAIAERVLEKSPRHQLAAYVIARLLLADGKGDSAAALLEETLDEERPQPDHLMLLASVRLKRGETNEAEALLQLAMEKFPHSSRWAKLLATIYLNRADDERLAAVLAPLVEREFDSPAIPAKLAELARDAGDDAAAQKWAMEGLLINAHDAGLHALLADAQAGQEKHLAAATSYERAVRLGGDAEEKARWRLAGARSLIRAERREEARAVLRELLEDSPDDSAALELLESLE